MTSLTFVTKLMMKFVTGASVFGCRAFGLGETTFGGLAFLVKRHFDW